MALSTKQRLLATHKTLHKVLHQIPFNTGIGGISGHFTKKALLEIFLDIESFLAETEAKTKEQVFLDVGCGEGYPLLYAAQCFSAIGIDIDPICIETFKTYTKHKIPTKFRAEVFLQNVVSVKSLPSKITLLYSFNKAFPPEVQRHFLQLLNEAFSKRTLRYAVISTSTLKQWPNWEKVCVQRKRISAAMAGSREVHSMSILVQKPPIATLVVEPEPNDNKWVFKYVELLEEGEQVDKALMKKAEKAREQYGQGHISPDYLEKSLYGPCFVGWLQYENTEIWHAYVVLQYQKYANFLEYLQTTYGLSPEFVHPAWRPGVMLLNVWCAMPGLGIPVLGHSLAKTTLFSLSPMFGGEFVDERAFEIWNKLTDLLVGRETLRLTGVANLSWISVKTHLPKLKQVLNELQLPKTGRKPRRKIRLKEIEEEKQTTKSLMASSPNLQKRHAKAVRSGKPVGTWEDDAQCKLCGGYWGTFQEHDLVDASFPWIGCSYCDAWWCPWCATSERVILHEKAYHA